MCHLVNKMNYELWMERNVDRSTLRTEDRDKEKVGNEDRH